MLTAAYISIEGRRLCTPDLLRRTSSYPQAQPPIRHCSVGPRSFAYTRGSVENKLVYFGRWHFKGSPQEKTWNLQDSLPKVWLFADLNEIKFRNLGRDSIKLHNVLPQRFGGCFDRRTCAICSPLQWHCGQAKGQSWSQWRKMYKNCECNCLYIVGNELHSAFQKILTVILTVVLTANYLSHIRASWMFPIVLESGLFLNYAELGIIFEVQLGQKKLSMFSTGLETIINEFVDKEWSVMKLSTADLFSKSTQYHRDRVTLIKCY